MAEDNPVRYERLKGLLDTVERLSGSNNLDDVVEIIRSGARRLLGADGITVILRDHDECHYVEEDAVGPLWKGQNFPMESCISGWAMLNGETAVIPDIALDPRIPQELYADTFVRSMVMAPIRPHDPVGAVGAYWSDAHEPSADVVEALEKIARAAAISIENARLVSALSLALSEAEDARDELRHRLSNAFAVTRSLALQTLPSEHGRPFAERVASLSRAYDLVDRKLVRESTIPIDELVKAELGVYRVEAPDRIVIEGDALRIAGDKAITLGIVLNELSTNALKYGALSTPAGQVSVQWGVERDVLVLRWEENGGPSVQSAAVESFGSRLVRRLVEGRLMGSVTRQLRRDGVYCIIEVPGFAGASAPAGR